MQGLAYASTGSRFPDAEPLQAYPLPNWTHRELLSTRLPQSKTSESTRVIERVNFQSLFESIDIFNRVNLSAFDTNPADCTFGRGRQHSNCPKLAVRGSCDLPGKIRQPASC